MVLLVFFVVYRDSSWFLPAVAYAPSPHPAYDDVDWVTSPAAFFGPCVQPAAFHQHTLPATLLTGSYVPRRRDVCPLHPDAFNAHASRSRAHTRPSGAAPANGNFLDGWLVLPRLPPPRPPHLPVTCSGRMAGWVQFGRAFTVCRTRVRTRLPTYPRPSPATIAVTHTVGRFALRLRDTRATWAILPFALFALLYAATCRAACSTPYAVGLGLCYPKFLRRLVLPSHATTVVGRLIVVVGPLPTGSAFGRCGLLRWTLLLTPDEQYGPWWTWGGSLLRLYFCLTTTHTALLRWRAATCLTRLYHTALARTFTYRLPYRPTPTMTDCSWTRPARLPPLAPPHAHRLHTAHCLPHHTWRSCL